MSSGKILELHNIRYVNLLKDVTFDWQQGEVIALMGINGAGKSTLARLIAGLLLPESGEIRMRQNGTYLQWEKLKRWQEIGYVGQHPRRQTIGATVAEELGFGQINLGLDRKTVRDRVKELTVQIGLKGKENQSPATLSGGERQRLVIAAILALNPSFLILDEALSMLDAKAQETILELLRNMRLKTGQLWITHDPELARQADRLLVLNQGAIADWGNPAEAFKYHYEELSLFDKRTVHLKQASLQARPGHESCKPVLEWEDADYNSRLRINNYIKPGEFIAVVGSSGAGKTTILESVFGFILPAKGRLSVFGKGMGKGNVNELRRKVGYVLQEAGEYLLGTSVFKEIFRETKNSVVNSLTEEQGLYLEGYEISLSLAWSSPERLSGGERQKVALAAAMRTVPEILLLDEPLLGLDAKSKVSIQTLIFALRGVTILFVNP